MVPNFCLGRKLQLQTNFFFLETTFPFLDLRSEGLSSLASLGRQLSFLPTISESESCLSEKKFVFICIPSLDKSLSPWRNYYSHMMAVVPF